MWFPGGFKQIIYFRGSLLITCPYVILFLLNYMPLFLLNTFLLRSLIVVFFVFGFSKFSLVSCWEFTKLHHILWFEQCLFLKELHAAIFGYEQTTITWYILLTELLCFSYLAISLVLNLPIEKFYSISLPQNQLWMKKNC